MKSPVMTFRNKLPIAAILLAFAAFVACAPTAFAHSYKLGKIAIGHAWAPPPDADGNTSVYVPIFNQGPEPAYLIGVATDAAEDAVMRIVKDDNARPVDRIEFKPGKPLALAPWREHIRVEHLKEPLKEGGSFDLVLDFGEAGKIKVAVEVEDQGGH